MDNKRMLDVIMARFSAWSPKTSTFGEEGFRIEIDNSYRTDRILIRGIRTLDGNIKWDVRGTESPSDVSMVEEVKRVVMSATQ